jgi:hypothetical protein
LIDNHHPVDLIHSAGQFAAKRLNDGAFQLFAFIVENGRALAQLVRTGYSIDSSHHNP